MLGSTLITISQEFEANCKSNSCVNTTSVPFYFTEQILFFIALGVSVTYIAEFTSLANIFVFSPCQ
jgi:hypothetical protein